jgi:hypothetical protein
MSPVDDHGLEAIRKSAEEVTSGDKSNYYIKTSAIRDVILSYFNPLVLPVVRFTRMVESSNQVIFINEQFIQFALTITSFSPLDVTLDENSIFLLELNTALILDTDIYLEI